MSKINPGLYSSKSHLWETPPDLLAAILKFEGRDEFDLDAACSKPNVPARNRIIHPAQDALTLDWWSLCNIPSPLVWLNPPYGALLKKFMVKCVEESLSCNIWLLVPARTETSYQQEYGLTKADFTVFLAGRLVFWRDGAPARMIDEETGEDKGVGTAPFPTMLMYYGADTAQKARRWVKAPPLKGTLMKVPT